MLEEFILSNSSALKSAPAGVSLQLVPPTPHPIPFSKQDLLGFYKP